VGKRGAGVRCRQWKSWTLCGRAALAACLLSPIASALMAAEHDRQLPAAAEEPPRAACAAAGEQILAANIVSSAVYQEQFSRYSPRTNRCYVEMHVETIGRDEGSDRFGRYLYDGRTKELLAFAQVRDGKKSGRVFDLNHRTTSFENAGFDDASEYIASMMTSEGR
jgi:hypothetical protein